MLSNSALKISAIATLPTNSSPFLSNAHWLEFLSPASRPLPESVQKQRNTTEIIRRIAWQKPISNFTSERLMHPIACFKFLSISKLTLNDTFI